MRSIFRAIAPQPELRLSCRKLNAESRISQCSIGCILLTVNAQVADVWDGFSRCRFIGLELCALLFFLYFFSLFPSRYCSTKVQTSARDLEALPEVDFLAKHGDLAFIDRAGDFENFFYKVILFVQLSLHR